MREILFRGLHRRRGEKVKLDGTPVESMWVYGGYCQYNEERGIIYQTEPEVNKFPVYADSVGQYTGLTDRNGTKIFEGDIVKMNSGKKYIGIVEYWEDCFRVVNHKIKYFDFVSMAADGFGEVIGNVYDNSEFLEGKEND